MASEKSRILIIGGTGFVGQFIVHASARAGHPTFALVRESSAASNPAKTKVLEDFKAAGVKLVYGDYNDHEDLVKAIKDVDVVISTVGHGQIADQPLIIAAIKEAGNVKVMDEITSLKQLGYPGSSKTSRTYIVITRHPENNELGWPRLSKTPVWRFHQPGNTRSLSRTPSSASSIYEDTCNCHHTSSNGCNNYKERASPP